MDEKKIDFVSEPIPVDSLWLSGQQETIVGIFCQKVPMGQIESMVCYNQNSGRLFVRRARRTSGGIGFVDSDHQAGPTYILCFAGAGFDRRHQWGI